MQQIISKGSERNSLHDHRTNPTKARSIDIVMFIKHRQRMNRSDRKLIESTSVQRNTMEYSRVFSSGAPSPDFFVRKLFVSQTQRCSYVLKSVGHLLITI